MLLFRHTFRAFDGSARDPRALPRLSAPTNACVPSSPRRALFFRWLGPSVSLENRLRQTDQASLESRFPAQVEGGNPRFTSWNDYAAQPWPSFKVAPKSASLRGKPRALAGQRSLPAASAGSELGPAARANVDLASWTCRWFA